jgi:hypothetical protein
VDVEIQLTLASSLSTLRTHTPLLSNMIDERSVNGKARAINVRVHDGYSHLITHYRLQDPQASATLSRQIINVKVEPTKC